MVDHLDENLLPLTADIVAAYVRNNRVTPAELRALIEQVSAALRSTAQPPPAAAKPALTPAVPVKKSVSPDFIISLEDGRKFKSLKRYLGTLGMTPNDYRTKWNLPADYPMVAPNYATMRSELARTLGLGRKAGNAPAATQLRKRGRPREDS